MDINKLTNQFRQYLSEAQSLAVRSDHSVIEPTHLIKVMVDDQSGSVSQILSQNGVNLSKLTESISKALNNMGTVTNPNGEMTTSQSLIRLLNQTDKLAGQKGDAYLSTELFFLAALN